MKIVTDTTANSILRQKALRVPDISAPEVQNLIDQMIATMHAENGAGLAAPQVDVAQRICVFNITKQQRNNPLVCINPVITKSSRELIMTEEGCLSIPGTFIPIVRAEKVSVRYYDRNGIRQTIHADGLLAVALQHEIDHLDGILMTDRYLAQENLRDEFEPLNTPATHRIG